MTTRQGLKSPLSKITLQDFLDSEYITKQEYQTKIQEIDQSISDITTALGNTISAQNVQVNGHNVVVNYTFTDEEVYGSMLQTEDDYIQ